MKINSNDFNPASSKAAQDPKLAKMYKELEKSSKGLTKLEKQNEDLRLTFNKFTKDSRSRYKDVINNSDPVDAATDNLNKLVGILSAMDEAADGISTTGASTKLWSGEIDISDNIKNSIKDIGLYFDSESFSLECDDDTVFESAVSEYVKYKKLEDFGVTFTFNNDGTVNVAVTDAGKFGGGDMIARDALLASSGLNNDATVNDQNTLNKLTAGKKYYEVFTTLKSKIEDSKNLLSSELKSMKELISKKVAEEGKKISDTEAKAQAYENSLIAKQQIHAMKMQQMEQKMQQMQMMMRAMLGFKE